MNQTEYPDIIIFYDENDEKVNQNVFIIEIKENYVTFINFSRNEITIPLNRVLKIKRRDDEGTV